MYSINISRIETYPTGVDVSFLLSILSINSVIILTFLSGQALSKSHQTNLQQKKEELLKLPCHKRMLLTHRRLIGLLIPAILYHVCWWALAIKYQFWGLFVDNYYMTLTMIVGSIVAGK